MISLNGFKRLVAPLWNRIYLLVGRAVLKAVNNAEGTQKAQILGLAGETLTDVERFQEYGLETYPEIEAEVAAIFPNGNRDRGIILCVHDRRYRPKDLAVGDVVVYTKRDSTVTHRIHFVAATGAINVEGTEVNLGSKTPADLKQLIDERFKLLFDLHIHSGVTAGGANSGVPTVPLNLITMATQIAKGA